MPTYRDLAIMGRERDDELRNVATKPISVTTVAIDYADSIAVEGRPGFIWVQVDSARQPFVVWGPKIPDRPGTVIWIARSPRKKNRWKALGTDSDVASAHASQQVSGTFVDPHAEQHEYPDGSPGADVVKVYPRAFVPLSLYVHAGLEIYVSSGHYNYNGTHTTFNTTYLNLAPYLPGAVDEVLRVLIYVDPSDNTLGVTSSAAVDDTFEPDFPDPPEYVFPVAWVKLYGDGRNLSESSHVVDAKVFYSLTDFTVVQFTRTILVDSGGMTDYDSIKDACDYVATQSPTTTTRWLILAYPGVYQEDPFTVPIFTAVRPMSKAASENPIEIEPTNWDSGIYISLLEGASLEGVFINHTDLSTTFTAPPILIDTTSTGATTRVIRDCHLTLFIQDSGAQVTLLKSQIATGTTYVINSYMYIRGRSVNSDTILAESAGLFGNITFERCRLLIQVDGTSACKVVACTNQSYAYVYSSVQYSIGSSDNYTALHADADGWSTIFVRQSVYENSSGTIDKVNENTQPVEEISSDTDLDHNYHTVNVDASGGDVWVFLPSATRHYGRKYAIKKIDSSTNSVFVWPYNYETIDDEDYVEMDVQYEAICIRSDGSNWWIY